MRIFTPKHFRVIKIEKNYDTYLDIPGYPNYSLTRNGDLLNKLVNISVHINGYEHITLHKSDVFMMDDLIKLTFALE